MNTDTADASAPAPRPPADQTCVLWYRGPNRIDWDLYDDERDAARMAATYELADRPLHILGVQFPDRTVPASEWAAFRDAYERQIHDEATFTPPPRPEPVRRVTDPFTGADVPVYESDEAPEWLGRPRG